MWPRHLSGSSGFQCATECRSFSISLEERETPSPVSPVIRIADDTDCRCDGGESSLSREGNGASEERTGELRTLSSVSISASAVGEWADMEIGSANRAIRKPTYRVMADRSANPHQNSKKANHAQNVFSIDETDAPTSVIGRIGRASSENRNRINAIAVIAKLGIGDLRFCPTTEDHATEKTSEAETTKLFWGRLKMGTSGESSSPVRLGAGWRSGSSKSQSSSIDSSHCQWIGGVL